MTHLPKTHLTIKQTAKTLRMPESWVLRLAEDGIAPAYKFGRTRPSIRIDVDDLGEWRSLAEKVSGGQLLELDPLEADTTGFVYFVQAEIGGPVKIGYARDPSKRLIELQIGCPFPLRILAIESGGRDRERQLHSWFAAHRLHGEWFRGDAPAIWREVEEARRLHGAPPQGKGLPRDVELSA